MQTPPVQRRDRTADLPLDQVANSPHVSKEEKLGAACRAFEAVLLRQILDSAQKTVIKSSVTTESASSSVYRDLITNQMADNIARSGQLGLATSFQDQLKVRTASAASPGKGPAPAPAPAAAATATPAAAVVPSPPTEGRPAVTRSAPAFYSPRYVTSLKPISHPSVSKPYRHE